MLYQWLAYSEELFSRLFVSDNDLVKRLTTLCIFHECTKFGKNLNNLIFVQAVN